MCTSTCMIKLYKAIYLCLTCCDSLCILKVLKRRMCSPLSGQHTKKHCQVVLVLLWPCLASLRWLPNVRRKRWPRGFGCERTKALWNRGILYSMTWRSLGLGQHVRGPKVDLWCLNSSKIPYQTKHLPQVNSVNRHHEIHPNDIFLHRYIPVSSHGLTNHLSEAASQGDGTWVALQGPFSAIPPAIGGSLASCARQSEHVASTQWPNAVAGAVRSIQNAARTWRPNRHWGECWTKDNYPWPMHRHKPHKRKHLQPKHHSFVAKTSQVPCSSAFHDDPWQLPHFLWQPLRSQSAPPQELIKWKLVWNWWTKVKKIYLHV